MRERRLVGGRDYQRLVIELKDSLDLMRKVIGELNFPNLPPDYRKLWAWKGETAYADGLQALWQIDSIGRAIKDGRLTGESEPSEGQG